MEKETKIKRMIYAVNRRRAERCCGKMVGRRRRQSLKYKERNVESSRKIPIGTLVKNTKNIYSRITKKQAVKNQITKILRRDSNINK
jgi:hypothetical protein